MRAALAARGRKPDDQLLLQALLDALAFGGARIERRFPACGHVYAAYTASSFAAPLTAYFRRYLRTSRRIEEPVGLFPTVASLETHTPDVFEERLFGPFFGGARRALRAVLPLQNGRVQAYVLYIVATLLVLLLFGLV